MQNDYSYHRIKGMKKGKDERATEKASNINHIYWSKENQTKKSTLHSSRRYYINKWIYFIILLTVSDFTIKYLKALRLLTDYNLVEKYLLKSWVLSIKFPRIFSNNQSYLH